MVTTAERRSVTAALERYVRHRWALLAVWAVAQWWIVSDHTGDWFYFRLAGRAILGDRIGRERLPGGIHMYASYPELQFGPPASILAAPAQALGSAGRPAYEIAIMVMGLPTLWLVEQAAIAWGQPVDRTRRFTLLAGLLVVHGWGVLAFGATHMDDALVLLGGAGTILLLARDRPVWAATIAGSAAAAKPWGVIVLALLVLVPPSRRLVAAVVGGGVLVAWWAPFLLDGHTVSSAGGHQIGESDNTPIHLLFPHLVRNPLWDRPVQLGCGLLLCAWIAYRHGPGSVLLAGISLRILIDPNNLDYYWSGLVVAALVHDAFGNRRLPLATVVAGLLSLELFYSGPRWSQGAASIVGVPICLALAILMPAGSPQRCDPAHVGLIPVATSD